MRIICNLGDVTCARKKLKNAFGAGAIVQEMRSTRRNISCFPKKFAAKHRSIYKGMIDLMKAYCDPVVEVYMRDVDLPMKSG